MNKGRRLYEKLDIYSKSSIYPFHMPGHKRKISFGENPYMYDITEIDGFDNLHHPRGIIRESMDRAAEFYGTERTYYLVNGSTCGLLAAIGAVTKKGDRIIMARNCHKSVYNGVYMGSLTVSYIYPEKAGVAGIYGGITIDSVKKVLDENEDAKALVITSPTYEGIVSDIRAIADEVHKRDRLLIVDEAHGAHFGIAEGFPATAVRNGADIVIQSVHKTLPSLTQTALLHVCSNRVDVERVEMYLGIYETSSPSYVLMASIENAIKYVSEKGEKVFSNYRINLDNFRKDVENLKNLKVLSRDIKGNNGIFDFDEGKLVIVTCEKEYTGYELQTELLEKYGLQMEMASPGYVIAMTSFADTEEGFKRLANALKSIDRRIESKGSQAITQEYPLMRTKVAMKICDAVNSGRERIRVEDSVGRVACEYVYMYPPGIPLIVPGEIITGDIIDYVRKCKLAGLEIIGQQDDDFKYMLVVER